MCQGFFDTHTVNKIVLSDSNTQVSFVKHNLSWHFIIKPPHLIYYLLSTPSHRAIQQSRKKHSPYERCYNVIVLNILVSMD